VNKKNNRVNISTITFGAESSKLIPAPFAVLVCVPSAFKIEFSGVREKREKKCVPKRYLLVSY
jgi:hypothetical protein